MEVVWCGRMSQRSAKRQTHRINWETTFSLYAPPKTHLVLSGFLYSFFFSLLNLLLFLIISNYLPRILKNIVTLKKKAIKQQFWELLRYNAINCITPNLLVIASEQIRYRGSSTILGTMDKTMNDTKTLPSKYFSK